MSRGEVPLLGQGRREYPKIFCNVVRVRLGLAGSPPTDVAIRPLTPVAFDALR